jgi:hypothetical protein
MPSHGVEIIDGIPVILRDGVMWAFQPDVPGAPTIKLGTYASSTKKAIWESSDSMGEWLKSHKNALASRSRK